MPNDSIEWHPIKTAPKNKRILVKGSYVADPGGIPWDPGFVFAGTEWAEIPVREEI